jgi:O-antigen/teichoic acid export membrane protein
VVGLGRFFYFVITLPALPVQAMKEEIRLGKNSLWLLAARVGAQSLALLTLLLARKLGSAGFGEYAFFTTAIFIGNVLSTSGTDMFFIREIAVRESLGPRDDDGNISRLSAALWIQLFLSSLLIVGIIMGAPLLPNQSTASILALKIYSLALIPLAFYTVFSTALRGEQRMGSYSLLTLGVVFLQAGVILLFMTGGGGVVTLAVLLLMAQGLAALLAGWICTRQIAGFWRGWRFSWQEVRSVFTASAPLGLLGILGILYQKLSLILLSILGGAVLTGLYSAALRVVEASKTVHLAVFTALYPAMSQAQADPHGQTAGAIKLSWKVLLAGATALALGLSLLAEPLVSILYGAGFESAAPVLVILAWTLIPYTVNTFLTLAFVAANNERAVGLALTAGLLGLILTGFWWLPIAGAAGVAWAVLGAECIQAFLLLVQTPASQRLFRGKSHGLPKLS